MLSNRDESGDSGQPSKADRDAAIEDAKRQKETGGKGGGKGSDKK